VRLHVAFHPSLLATGAVVPVPADRPQVCVVVDVLRASTSLVTLVERGAGPIHIATSVAAARESPVARAGAVLAGEQEGVAPPGFDFGNSPVELARAPVRGRPVVFVTTNGTAAIQAVRRLGPVLVGAMRNATAVAAEAWAAAQASASDLTIVCAGREGGFGFDDAYCAGVLVSRLLPLGTLELTDGAAAALQLFRAEPDAEAVFTRSAAGQNVIRLGLGADVAFCAARDRSTAVPRLGRELRMLEEEGAREVREGGEGGAACDG